MKSNIFIIERKLTGEESGLLEQETKKSIDIGLIDKTMWNSFDELFVIGMTDMFIGACAIMYLHGWIKVGPIVILERFQGKGCGAKLLYHIVNRYKNKNIYIGSSNKKVQSIVKKLHFQTEHHFLKLPREIQLYLINYLVRRISWKFVIDALRKRLFIQRNTYLYFLKLYEN